MNSFRDKVIAKASEEREKKEHRKKFLDRILRDLPGVVDAVLNQFLERWKGIPIEPQIEPIDIQLSWAYDESALGRVSVKKLRLEVGERFLSVELNPVIGYIGATARIDLKTHKIQPESRSPLGRMELFVSVGHESREPNTVFYLDKANQTREFTSEIAEGILEAVFLDE